MKDDRTFGRVGLLYSRKAAILVTMLVRMQPLHRNGVAQIHIYPSVLPHTSNLTFLIHEYHGHFLWTNLGTLVSKHAYYDTSKKEEYGSINFLWDLADELIMRGNFFLDIVLHYMGTRLVDATLDAFSINGPFGGQGVVVKRGTTSGVLRVGCGANPTSAQIISWCNAVPNLGAGGRLGHSNDYHAIGN